MKGIFLVLFSFASIYYVAAQNDSIYAKAIFLHVQDINSDTVYILKCDDIGLPNRVGKCHLIEYNPSNKTIKGRYEKLVIKVMPIEANKGFFDVSVIDYLVTNGKRGVNFANTGSDVFTFSYDNKLGEYILIKRQKNGI